jgi:hypothetical protein
MVHEERMGKGRRHYRAKSVVKIETGMVDLGQLEQVLGTGRVDAQCQGRVHSDRRQQH